MPKALHRMQGGVWKAVIGSDIVVTPPTPPPPVVTTPPTVVGVGTFYANVGAISPTWPSGHVAGDVGLMFIQTCNQGIGSLPSGWAHITGSPFGTGTAGSAGSVALTILWKRATSSSEAQLSIGDSGDHQIAQIIAFRGVRDTGNPWDVIGSDVLSTAATAVSIPGGTTTMDKTLIVAVVANAVDLSAAQTGSWAAGYTEQTDHNTLQGHGGGFGVATDVKDVFGAYSAITATLANSSKQARVSIALAPSAASTPPVGTHRTYFASAGLDQALWGSAVTPDTILTSGSGDQLVETNGYIDQARNAGGSLTPRSCFYIRQYGANSTVGAPGPLNVTTWKNKFDDWIDGIEAFTGTGSWGTGGIAKLREGVRDGIVRGVMILDDIVVTSGDNAFGTLVTFEQVEELSAYVKATLPWLPCYVAAANSHMRSIAVSGGQVRQYASLDAAQVNWRARQDGLLTNINNFVASQILAGQQCGLGTRGGLNIADRGSGDCALNGNWSPGGGASCCFAGNKPHLCAMSPHEITTAGLAYLARQEVAGLHVWSYAGATSYWIRSDIQAALATVAAAAASRIDGPVNIRGDLVAA